LTDNKARTAASIKAAISKYNGSFSAVLYNFVRRGVLVISSDQPFDNVFEQAIDLGAEDLEQVEEGTFKVSYLLRFN
jgi:transcriptional/translational regulatory protein YebC/TACO1